MDDIAQKHFAQVVYNYCGLNYLDKLTSMHTKLKKRLEQLNISSYWEYVRYIEQHEEEWVQVVDCLTVNETYFFREDKQFAELELDVIPKLLTKNDSVKIWCAACSTGDEPYSIAMTLNKYVEQNRAIHILATDINERVLSIARSGTYNRTSLSFRRIPEEWIAQYFDVDDMTYTVKNQLKQRIQFEKINLYNGTEYPANNQFDIIFCRNVLIYFDEQTVKKIIEKFYDVLKPGGYLFLGHAESITKFNLKYKVISRGGTFYYQKDV